MENKYSYIRLKAMNKKTTKRILTSFDCKNFHFTQREPFLGTKTDEDISTTRWFWACDELRLSFTKCSWVVGTPA